MGDSRILSAHGTEVPAELLGELKPTAADVGGAVMREQIERDGYLYMPGALDREAVLAARAEVFGRLAEVGEICEPAAEGISTGSSQRGELIDDLGTFWKSVSEGAAVRQVTHAGPIVSLMEKFLGGVVEPYDFLWLRAMHRGRASAYHFDHVYMNRGTANLFTVWTPLGDMSLEEGPIAMVEGAHLWEDLIAEYRGFDVEVDTSRLGHVTMDPVALVKERGTRLLTAEFRAGDVLVFPMFNLHGSLDNRSAEGRVRLSCDTRYQLASEKFDERWVGSDPIGHGTGYASLSGAQPATSEPLFR
jgi:ectoine hydroxylase-related dioxygenase (phytanoyl-CoA dioxygenase family)